MSTSDHPEAPPDAPAPDAPAPSAAPARPALNAQGMERPAFVLAFPEDPALERLVRAFEAGNYARIRSDAPRVAAEASSPEVREAALELRRRIDPDPLAKYLLAITVALFAFLVVWAYGLDVH